MAMLNSIAKAYADRRMIEGASHALIFKELSELHFDRSQIEHAFNAIERAHYEICPKKVTEEEILLPLKRYIDGIIRHSKPSKDELLAAIKKKGWTDKDFENACRKSSISPKTLKILKKKR